MSAGSIVIDLVMKTGMFETDSKRAEKRLADFGKRARQVGTAIGVAMSAATVSLSAMVKQSINNMDTLTKLSQSVGSTTEELSALTYAADLSGVSQDSLGTALVRLTKNASDARQGLGEARKGFDALGISVTDAGGKLKDSTQLLQEVAGKFAQFEDGADKTALAVSLFGRAGAQLIPLLNAGADGIAEMTAEAEELGLTFDQNTGKAAEQFNDNLTRLRSVVPGLTNRLTKELLPSLVNITNRLVGSAKSAERLDKIARATATGIKILGSAAAIVAGIFRTVGEYIGGLAAALVSVIQGRFSEAWDIAKNVTSDVAGNIRQTVDDVKVFWGDAADDVAAGAEDNAEKLAAPAIEAEKKVKSASDRIADQARRIYERVEASISGIQRSIATFNMSEEEVQLFDLRMMGADPEQIDRATAALRDLYDMRRANADLDERNAAAERANQVLGDINLEIEALGKSAEWIATRNALIRAGVEAESEFGQQVIASVEELYRRGEAIDDQITIMDGLRDSARGFLDDLRAGEGVWDSLKNAAQRFADVLFELAAQGIIEQMFGKQGEAGGGGWGNMIGSALGAMFGGARAGGGDVLPGRAFLVGEQAPELFIPRTAGTVLPAADTRAALAGGGGRVNQVNNFHYAAPPDPRTQVQTAARVGFEVRRAQRRLG